MDESQELIQTNDGCFENSKREKRSVLYALSKSFMLLSPFSVTFSGTGLLLQSSFDILGSNVVKSIDGLNDQIVMNNFFSKEKVLEFCKNIIPGFEADEHEVIQWLVGRPRITCSFLEVLMNQNIDVKSAFIKFKEIMTSKDTSDVRSKGFYTLFENLQYRSKPEFANENYTKVKEIIKSYVFTGLPVFLHDEKDATLFEVGIGRLTKLSNFEVTIDEPMVVYAGLLCYKNAFEREDNGLFSRYRFNPSLLGTFWEDCLPSGLTKYFVGSMEKKFSNFPKELSEFDCKVEILNSYLTNVLLSKATDAYGLVEYLQNPNAPFFYPEILAGPDIVFYVQLIKGNESRRFPVFVQSKLSKRVNSVSKAIKTTNPGNMWSDKDGNVSNLDKQAKVVALCENGYFSLILLFPHECKKILTKASGNRFLKVIHGGNATEFFEEKEIALLLSLKKDALDNFDIVQ